MINKDIGTKDRWQEIRDIWEESAALWLIPGLIVGVAIGFVLGIFASSKVEDGFLEGIWPEVLSTGFGVALLYYLDRWRDQVSSRSQLKKELLWQAQSRSHDIALSAIDRMRYEKWLDGSSGLLKDLEYSNQILKWQGANLAGANLQMAYLGGAELQEAQLWGANLERCSLSHAKLSKARMPLTILRGADLTGATLEDTELVQSDMRWCHLDRANLYRANLTSSHLEFSALRQVNAQYAGLFLVRLNNSDLSGTNLKEAYLLGADVEGVTWADDHYGPTILPDGSVYRDELDIQKFIDPNHPNLWIPEWIRTIMRDDGIERNIATAQHVMKSRVGILDDPNYPFWVPPDIEEALNSEAKEVQSKV